MNWYFYFSEARSVVALLALPSQLNEKSPILSRKDFEALDDTAKLNAYVIAEGEPMSDNELYKITIDNTCIATTNSLIVAMKTLIGTIYVFNGAFPKAHLACFTFLQKVIINLQDKQPRNKKVVSLAGQIAHVLD